MTHVACILRVACLLSLAACSFNRAYLQPDKVPPGAKSLTIATPQDTTVIRFSPDTHQPTFLRAGRDTLRFDFTITSVVFPAADGHQLNGWLLQPKTGRPTITLLHLHGNAGFLLSQYGAITPLLARGFQVFMFDYSGFGFSEGPATRRAALADANAALTYLKARPEVTGTRLVLYGQSFGGSVAAVLAARRQADIDGLVTEGAFSSHRDIAAQSAGFVGRLLVREEFSAKDSIGRFTKPVLVIHSREDNVVPFRLGQKLFRHANQPKTFYPIQHCHICGPSYYADSIATKIKTMLR